MLSAAVVIIAALLWLGLLFAAGVYGERHPQAFARHWPHVYALSLAVHCTSWTFYGTVTQGGSSGTIGVQRDTGSLQVQYACNTAGSVAAGLLITWGSSPASRLLPP